MNLKELWAPFAGAVSLTFDDGRQSQLDEAIPAMDRLGIKGTFYLNPAGAGWDRNRAAWQAAAARGHEIGNHTLSHSCSSNISGSGGVEEMTLEEIESDILAAQERLVEIAPQQKGWSLAYPCNQSHVGRGISRKSYVPVVARHFLAGRAAGEYGLANHPAGVDLACAWGLDTSRMSGFEMIGLVEELTNRGRWVVLIFHEIDGPCLSVSGCDFEMLLGYLHRNAERIWTAPFVEVAQYIANHRDEATGD